MWIIEKCLAVVSTTYFQMRKRPSERTGSWIPTLELLAGHGHRSALLRGAASTIGPIEVLECRIAPSTTTAPNAPSPADTTAPQVDPFQELGNSIADVFKVVTEGLGKQAQNAAFDLNFPDFTKLIQQTERAAELAKTQPEFLGTGGADGSPSDGTQFGERFNDFLRDRVDSLGLSFGARVGFAGGVLICSSIPQVLQRFSSRRYATRLEAAPGFPAADRATPG